MSLARGEIGLVAVQDAYLCQKALHELLCRLAVRLRNLGLSVLNSGVCQGLAVR
jgi:hypothetical protein